MGLFDKHEPVILKKDSSAKAQLEALESLRGTLPPAAEKRLGADIRALQAGIVGEERILYELQNSHMDMFVLHDLYLEHNGLTAQIDFLVATPQRIFVLESKQLFGYIEITKRGDFIRSFGKKREGIYSPITQNQRHLELIHAMKRDSRGLAMNLLVDGDFDDIYRSLVVLANPKTVLKDRYATKEVKRQVVRADQLVSTIKAINNEKGPGREKISRSATQKRAEWFLAQHKENPVDYAAKYRAIAEEAADTEPEVVAADSQQEEPTQTLACPRCGAEMVLRTAKQGERAGKQFYGCSRFPHCRGIVNIED